MLYHLDINNIEQILIILYCFAKNAIDGCIATKIQIENLYLSLTNGYTNHNISNSQRYKMIGNGFTVNVIAHKTRYAWAYAPINMTTAFLSVVFLIPSLFMPTINNAYMLGIAIFLLLRNIYYTIEDIIDYPTNPKMQLFFIALDLLMAIYVTFWIKNL